MEGIKLCKEAKELVRLFEKRFGNKYTNNIISKLNGIEIKVEKKAYDRWWGTVDRKGNVTVNTMSKESKLEHVAPHELLHKVNSIISADGKSISYYEAGPGEFKVEYVPIFVEYVTEWITSQLTDEETYLLNSKNSYIKSRGIESAYSYGTNLISALTAIVGEDVILSTYVGETKFETFIENYDKQYGKGGFLKYWNLLEDFGMPKNNKKDRYSTVLNHVLETYIKKQESNEEYNEEGIEEMHQEIEKLTLVMPQYLKDVEPTGIDNNIKQIQKRYIEICNSKGIQAKEFTSLDIDKKKKDILLHITNAVEFEPENLKKIFGVEYIMDETEDLRNNLYRAMNQLIHADEIVKGDKYTMDIFDKIATLPATLDSDVTLERYVSVYEYINIYMNMKMLQELDGGTRGTVRDYMDYRSNFTYIKENSLIDVKNKKILGNMEKVAKTFNRLLEVNVNENEMLVPSSNLSEEEHKKQKKFLEGLKIDDDFLRLTQEEWMERRPKQMKNNPQAR